MALVKVAFHRPSGVWFYGFINLDHNQIATHLRVSGYVRGGALAKVAFNRLRVWFLTGRRLWRKVASSTGDTASSRSESHTPEYRDWRQVATDSHSDST